MTTFIHTADWQLGKPFAGIRDVTKRSLVQRMPAAIRNNLNRGINENTVRSYLDKQANP